jgi:hypothetical protein
LFEQRLCADVVEALGPERSATLEAFVADGTSGSLLSVLKADPGPAGLESLLLEVEKLSAAQGLELPVNLFAGVSEKVVGAWRARAARMYPSDFRDAPDAVRLTLLAALCHQRTAEIADSLVDLLLVLVLKINTSAVKKVEKELTEDLQRVRGKTALLFKLAETAVACPDETVREAVFPVVSEKTLRQLARRQKPTRACSKARSAQCCAVPIRIITGGCCRHCCPCCGSGAITRRFVPSWMLSRCWSGTRRLAARASFSHPRR